MPDLFNQPQGRRQFIAKSAAAVAAGSLPRVATAAEESASTGTSPICAFTKPFNSLSFDELADRMAEIGFDGIEAPVRAKGHVEPTEVEDRLPELHEALAKRGLDITVMATDINDPDDPITHRVLRTAATLGIKRYRMKYFKYDPKKSVLKQIDSWKRQVRELAAINHEFGIRGLYQNHAGSNYCGAPIWDLHRLLEGVSPTDLAVAYDIRHATAEGGTSWPITFNMIRPSIDTVYIKDFNWGDGERPLNVPLGDGRINPKFFKLLKENNFDGPISLHEEYLDHADPKLVPQHLESLKKDLAKLREWLA